MCVQICKVFSFSVIFIIFDFIRGLLQNIGTRVSPIILIGRIPNNLEIPGLRDSIVKIL